MLIFTASQYIQVVKITALRFSEKRPASDFAFYNSLFAAKTENHHNHRPPMFILRSLTTAIGLLRPTAKEGLYSPASSDFLESFIERINIF